jgi:hypothetical protein
MPSPDGWPAFAAVGKAGLSGLRTYEDSPWVVATLTSDSRALAVASIRVSGLPPQIAWP